METKTWKEWFSHWNIWFWESSKIVGAPVLLCLLLVFAQRLVFTGTCALAGYQCQYGFGSAESIANKVTQSLAPSDANADDRGELIAKIEMESENDKERLDKVVAAAKKAAASPTGK